MLLHESVELFQSIIPLLLPEVFEDAVVQKVSIYDETAVMPYSFDRAFDLEELMNYFEDQMEFNILYHFCLSDSVSFGHQCCAYADERFGHMVKINVSTNDNGLVDSAIVTVFDSLEVMVTDLLGDLRRHEKFGHFVYRQAEEDLLVEFC